MIQLANPQLCSASTVHVLDVPLNMQIPFCGLGKQWMVDYPKPWDPVSM